MAIVVFKLPLVPSFSDTCPLDQRREAALQYLSAGDPGMMRRKNGKCLYQHLEVAFLAGGTIADSSMHPLCPLDDRPLDILIARFTLIIEVLLVLIFLSVEKDETAGSKAGLL